MKLKHLALGLVTAFTLTVQSRAANLVVDDSDLNNVTITATGFNNFFVNGNLLASGSSATFADGGIINFAGSWFNGGSGPGPTQSAFFGDTELRSGIDFSALLLGANPLISYFDVDSTHAFLGYDPSFHTDGDFAPLFAQDGSTASGSIPGLTWSFKSEGAQVPDSGTTVVLLSGACIGIAALRRRLKN